MNNSTEQPWINVGYTLLAEAGPEALKIERLARRVGKSKSSFYHCFADLEGFVERLLDWHLQRIALIAERERACERVDPDLLDILMDIKEDLLFQRQLRIHRQREAFADCLKKANETTAYTIAKIWAEAIGLPMHTELANLVLMLSMENFFLQLNEQTLNYEWLRGYIRQYRQLVQAIQASDRTNPMAALLEGDSKP